MQMKKGLGIVLTLSLVLILTACGSSNTKSANGDAASSGGGKSSSNQAETTFEKAKSTGKVVVGFAGEEPYAYKDKDGKLTGEAVETARAVLKKLGINEMEGVLTEFGSLIPGLNAKRFDMITAGMFVNPDRCKQVSFADPEYKIGESLAVEKGNPSNLHSYKDVASAKDVKVAVMTGAAEKDYMLKSGVAKDQIIIVPDQPTAVADLQSGRVQAITMTGPSLEAMLVSAKDEKIQRVDDFQQPVIDGKEIWGYGATAFRKDDQDFRDAFTAELNKMKQSDELLNIVSPFGFTKTELPGDMTAEQLCK